MALSKDGWFKFFPSKFMDDTEHLTAAETGAYMALISKYMIARSPLQDDDRKLAAMARVSRAEWPEIREALTEFFRVEDGVWIHDFCELIIEDRLTAHQRRKDAGKKGGKAKASNASEKSSNAKDISSNASEKPSGATENPSKVYQKRREEKRRDKSTPPTDSSESSASDPPEPTASQPAGQSVDEWFPQVEPSGVRDRWLEFRATRGKPNDKFTLHNAITQLTPLSPERRGEVIADALEHGHVSIQAYHLGKAGPKPADDPPLINLRDVNP